MVVVVVVGRRLHSRSRCVSPALWTLASALTQWAARPRMAACSDAYTRMARGACVWKGAYLGAARRSCATCVVLVPTLRAPCPTSLWTFYGAAVLVDPYIWIPNGLGLASGLARLAMFAKYGFGPPKDDAH